MAKPGKVLVHLGHQRHRRASRLALTEQGNQVQRQIRVAAQADLAGLPMGLARRHHLGDDIDTHRHQIANGMGIVGTHVMPLLGTIVQVTAGFKEELRDLNILRKTVCRYIPGIGQFRNPAIEALNKRPHETLFQ